MHNIIDEKIRFIIIDNMIIIKKYKEIIYRNFRNKKLH